MNAPAAAENRPAGGRMTRGTATDAATSGTTTTTTTSRDAFPTVAAALASLTEQEQRVALVRLATRFNCGDEHFDHSPRGASWLCLKCKREAIVR